MKNRLKRKIFYNVENIDYDVILNNHHKLWNELKDKYSETRKQRLSTNKTLRKKYEFFIHNLISRQKESDNGVAYLSSTILEKVLGKDYVIIKNNLIKMNIIITDDFYILKTKSYGFWINPEYNITSRMVSLYYPDENYCKKLKKNIKNDRN